MDDGEIRWIPDNDMWRPEGHPDCLCNGYWSRPEPDDGRGSRCDEHRLTIAEHEYMSKQMKGTK
jgi:hypothetical protein